MQHADPETVFPAVHGDADPEAVGDPLGPVDEECGGVRAANLLDGLPEQPSQRSK
jgi:hypothetical protein